MRLPTLIPLNGVRGLSTKIPNLSETASGCLAACFAGSYVYCGVQYYGECWGGQAIGETSQRATLATDCTFTCDGDTSEYCGGKSQMDVYYSSTVSKSPLVFTLFLLSSISLSVMLTRRFPAWGTWRTTASARLAVVCLLGTSLTFIFLAGLFTIGLGTLRSKMSCNTGTWLCVLLYAATKLIVTVFYIERRTLRRRLRYTRERY
ncbi:hypothetical protein RQP46_000919 [Phenoliferia psychrophenolica]